MLRAIADGLCSHYLMVYASRRGAIYDCFSVRDYIALDVSFALLLMTDAAQDNASQDEIYRIENKKSDERFLFRSFFCVDYTPSPK